MPFVSLPRVVSPTNSLRCDIVSWAGGKNTMSSTSSTCTPPDIFVTGKDGCRFVIGGASPTSHDFLLSFSADMPFFCFVVA